MPKTMKETNSSVSSDSRTLPITRRDMVIALPPPPPNHASAASRAGPWPGTRRSPLAAAAKILEVQIEVLRPRLIPRAALAHGKHLVDEHRDDHAALGRQHLAGLLVELDALRRVDGGVGLEQQGVVIRPLPVGLLPLGALGVGDRK